MLVGAPGGDPPARRTLEEAQLQQERLVDILNRIDLLGQRMSESTRQELHTTATEVTPGAYEVELAEARARDLAAKTANLGLLVIAGKIRQEVDGLTLQRRQGEKP